LDNYAWNAISLQPFDRGLDGTESDPLMAANFINRAKSKSPNMQIYVYSRWPRKQSTYPETADGWNQLWTRTYGSSGPNTEETKDYFEKLTRQLRTNHPDIKPVLLVPVGQVFYAMNQKMAAGQVPGYSSIWQVYSDGIHMNGVGSYIASCTYFATLYSQSPVGLSVPSQYGTIDPSLARIIQETAWNVVINEPLSGVTADNSGNTYKAAETPSGTVAGLTYNYYEGSWTTLPSFPSLTAVKTGNVATFDLTPKNRADNFGFRYTGYVNVPSDGVYTFYTSSDDGSKLYIGTQLVVNNDGLHGPTETSGTISLKAGKHSITVDFFEATGGEILTVSYSGPSVAKTTIPASALSSVPPTTANRPPTALLNASPTSGSAPLTVSFNANGSSDPDAGDYILGYEWDFGDGSAFSNSNAPSHTYTAAGTYTAKLRVMDNHNLYGSQVSKTITVSGSTSTTKYEAENAALTGMAVATSAAGYSGAGYADGMDATGDKITFTVNVASTGSYALVFRFRNSCTPCEKYQDVKINSAAPVYTQFNNTVSGWQDKSYGNVSLNAGNNTIEINKSWGFTAIDYITISPAGSAREGYFGFLEEGQAVTLYPNPVTGDRIHVKIVAQDVGPATVSLINTANQTISTVNAQLQEGINLVNIPVKGLVGGLYFTAVQQGEKRTVLKVIIP
jgi:PKD repeat protein